MNKAICLVALTAIALPAGCGGGVYFADDIDIELNFSLLSGPSDELHMPYVQGTKVTIWARENDGEHSRHDWWLESSDSRVLRIDSQSRGHADCRAVGPGTAVLAVYEHKGDTHPLHTRTVSVRAPTRVELYANGFLILDWPKERSQLFNPRVLVNGTTTLLVQYYAEDSRLYGNGVLETESDPAVLLSTDTTFLFENREWLRISPTDLGSYEVKLSAAGVDVGSFDVISVGPESVQRIELIGENESDADEGDLLTVLAQAYDGDDRPIFGVAYQWDLDGETEDGLGDLFRYRFDPEVVADLGADFDGLRAEATVNASSGYVSSSNNIGCSVGRAADPHAAAALLAPLLLLLALRVRRR